ncbi:hypothetical protein [uncultured Aquimarina sp.]|uniref:hypothetical protein n=1 Tax=uncultured Aquimarina sp. TaxID=575652 RepID=UPI0026362EBA|nr:hypothetical protein [uncultured Aquimarina sp.]
MKNIIYLVSIFFSLLLGLSSCKHNDNKKIKIEESLNEVSSKVIDQLDQRELKHSIKDFQGVWISFSSYLEHESAFKDYNQNKYFKIVNKKKTLDITLVDHQENNIEFNQGYLGFLDIDNSISSSSEETLIKKLKESGSRLIRFKKGQEKYDKTNIEISSGFNRYFDVTEILEDGFDYNEKDKFVSFRLVSSLPMGIFKILKSKSKKEGIDYIKEYNLQELSSKIKVTIDKTFFHTEMSEASKRKAFLVKGDIAYLEEINDDWAKVYYDGNVVSGGYIKRSDIDILE